MLSLRANSNAFSFVGRSVLSPQEIRAKLNEKLEYIEHFIRFRLQDGYSWEVDSDNNGGASLECFPGPSHSPKQTVVSHEKRMSVRDHGKRHR